MNIFKITGKFLDQPILVKTFEQTVPPLLAIGGATIINNKVKNAKPNEKKETAIKLGTTMLITIVSALLAPKITNKIFHNKTKNLKELKEENTILIDEFIKTTKVDKQTEKILNKAKTKILSFSEIKDLYKKNENQTEFLNKLIPEPKNITSKEIFSEIGRLSLLGFIPVLGGIAGGILGDKLSKNDWKENLPNKIKEGSYQYLANIFLCNIGAGIALALMERSGIRSKSARAMGMVGGIMTTGVIGGSAIANLIGSKIINPIFGKKEDNSLYSERKPEALDIGLHVDDIATVAVMSGLKWIEPALPIMYSISGYRAGIGYRNKNKS